MSSKNIQTTEIVMVPNGVTEITYASTGIEPNLEELLKKNEDTQGNDPRTSIGNDTKNSK